MKLAKIRISGGSLGIAIVEEDHLQLLDMTQLEEYHCLYDILVAKDPVNLSKFLVNTKESSLSFDEVEFLAPVDQQEIWAAGVTYKRSQIARMEESDTGASHYDKVYSADRPELFLKATPNRVSGPGQSVRVRYDSNWSVPEPELALMVSADLRLVGYTIGNDMSARDIEGENPLYLPQAKVYNQCCALGPVVLIPEEPLCGKDVKIELSINRENQEVFKGETSLDQMARTHKNLISWLGRENEFSHGAILLTGTGFIPPDEFSLKNGDIVSISIEGIGTLVNPVVKDAG